MYCGVCNNTIVKRFLFIHSVMYVLYFIIAVILHLEITSSYTAEIGCYIVYRIGDKSRVYVIFPIDLIYIFRFILKELKIIYFNLCFCTLHTLKKKIYIYIDYRI